MHRGRSRFLAKSREAPHPLTARRSTRDGRRSRPTCGDFCKRPRSVQRAQAERHANEELARNRWKEHVMADIENLTDLFIQKLRRVYDAEKRLMKALPQLRD